MRRKLSKAERQRVYEKCSGHCAYCGCELEYKDMQVDHMKPLRTGGADELSNMLPACRSCNHYKSTLDLEGFRNYLGGIHKRLMRDSIPFQVAARFGIVKYVGDNVVFYFESGEQLPCILKGIEPACDKRPCIGYQKSKEDDEPCEMCKECMWCDGEEPESEGL